MQTPYITFNSEQLEKNYQYFENLCRSYLQRYIIAYSVKTNSHLPLLKYLDNLGSNFEIASLKEIKMTDFSKKSKIFNSPCKSEEELKTAINKRFLINIDSISEIDKISKILNNQRFNIGLRISLNNSKFGFDLDQTQETIDYLKTKNLNLIALHFHQGTQQNLLEYEKNLEKIEKITLDIINKNKIELKYIDIGGGFPDKFNLKNLNKSLEDYFQIISKNLKKLSDQNNLSIILEPGRCLVSDAFELITKVNCIKKKSETTYAILDAGINILPKITLSQYKFSKLNPENQTEKTTYRLAGPLLFNNDILGTYIGNLKENDLFKVENIGAYCYNLAWEIIYDKPKILT